MDSTSRPSRLVGSTHVFYRIIKISPLSSSVIQIKSHRNAASLKPGFQTGIFYGHWTRIPHSSLADAKDPKLHVHSHANPNGKCPQTVALDDDFGAKGQH